MLFEQVQTPSPELLAPAGDWDCVRAAVANGANAVYFGLPQFNARLRAENFTEKDLPELMDYLHQRNVKGFVAFNTLIFTDELWKAKAQLELLQACKVDAIIVQDIGLVKLAQEVAPDVEVHASTQMTLTSPEGVLFAKSLGVTRAVLAREVSLRELVKFRKTEKTNDSASTHSDISRFPVPIEVFVHGALCVAYSGQCLTSEALGQRSANRRECAQACRLPYDLIVDNKLKNLGDKKYLLSPQDLAAIEEIPSLIDLGVASFKIEGRLKAPEYVAAVTRVYRKAIDDAIKAKNAKQQLTPKTLITHKDRYDLEMAFSRGLFTGWMHGVDHQNLVHARFGKKRGAFVGYVHSIGPDFVELETLPSFPIQPGDGFVFDTGHDTDHEQGGRLYQLRGKKLYFARGKIQFEKLEAGHRVWKTDDPKLNAQLQSTYAKDSLISRKKIAFNVTGSIGSEMKLEASLLPNPSIVCEAVSSIPLQAATQRPLTQEIVQHQLSRLGETPFELGHLSFQISDSVILPLSELNKMRRELVHLLAQKCAEEGEASTKKLSSNDTRPSLLDSVFVRKSSRVAATEPSFSLSVLCRTQEQLEIAIANHIQTIYVDFEDIRRYRDAVNLAHNTSSAIFLATPRIQKAGEHGFFKLIENAAPAGVLIRNLGGLEFYKSQTHLRRIGDFSLNIANPLTAQILKGAGDFERLTISYDLNKQQVTDLLEHSSPQWFELTLHQHMPLFHMEHCVFAAFLSEGKDHLTCGRPCDRHQIKLRDRVGLSHPVKADVGCRNTVFHAQAQSGAQDLEAFQALGLKHFRLEFLNENKTQAQNLITQYLAFYSGQITSSQLFATTNARHQLGVTRS